MSPVNWYAPVDLSPQMAHLTMVPAWHLLVFEFRTLVVVQFLLLSLSF